MIRTRVERRLLFLLSKQPALIGEGSRSVTLRDECINVECISQHLCSKMNMQYAYRSVAARRCVCGKSIPGLHENLLPNFPGSIVITVGVLVPLAQADAQATLKTYISTIEQLETFQKSASCCWSEEALLPPQFLTEKINK